MLTAYYFSAKWCLPCKTFKQPALSLLAAKGIPITQVDVDDEWDLAETFRVHSVPTIIFVGDEPDQAYGPSNEKARLVGASVPNLVKLIAEVNGG